MGWIASILNEKAEEQLQERSRFVDQKVAKVSDSGISLPSWRPMLDGPEMHGVKDEYTWAKAWISAWSEADTRGEDTLERALGRNVELLISSFEGPFVKAFVRDMDKASEILGVDETDLKTLARPLILEMLERVVMEKQDG